MSQRPYPFSMYTHTSIYFNISHDHPFSKPIRAVFVKDSYHKNILSNHYEV